MSGLPEPPCEGSGVTSAIPQAANKRLRAAAAQRPAAVGRLRT